MSTDFTKSFRFWRLTFSVSLPEWLKSVKPWLFHPIATIKELHRLRRQRLLEEKWERLFSTAFTQRPAPEFEFDEKHPGRVKGLKETPKEAALPSVGVWSAGYDKGSLDRAVRSAGMKVDFTPAPEGVVEERRKRVDQIQDEIWDEQFKKRSKKRSKK